MNEKAEPLAMVPMVEPSGGMLIDVASLQAGLEQRAKMLNAFRDWMGKLLVSGRDYAVIPGTQKPSLLKPGAETLALAAGARFVEIEEVRQELPGGHLEVKYHLELVQRNGEVLGLGIGSCSTMESRYRYRKASRKCPSCGKEAIIKGKEEFGGGWLCYKKKGGCGAKFKVGDEDIESQIEGQVENENPADQRNTVLKMAKKRAMVDAVLTAFGLSDFFTQDVEEFVERTEPVFEEVPAPQPQLKPDAPRWKPNGEKYSALWSAARAYLLESEGMAAAANNSKVTTTLKNWSAKVLLRPMESDSDMETVKKALSAETDKLRGGSPTTVVSEKAVVPSDLPF